MTVMLLFLSLLPAVLWNFLCVHGPHLLLFGLIPQNSCIHGHNTPGPRNFVCFSWIGHVIPHFGNIVHVFLLSEIFFPPLVWVIFAHFFLFASNFLSFRNLLWCPNPELVISLCAHPGIVYIEVERPTKGKKNYPLESNAQGMYWGLAMFDVSC